jgi:exodeoxyribonuclease VII large subunit
VLLEDRRRLLDEHWNAASALLDKKISLGRSGLSALAGKADALSPLKVLSRGYAVPVSQGRVLSSINDFEDGSRFSLRVSDGTVRAITEYSERNV